MTQATGNSSPLKSACEDVSARLREINERDLWLPMQNELLRPDGGPDACVEYLEAERARFVERVREALDRLIRPSSE